MNIETISYEPSDKGLSVYDHVHAVINDTARKRGSTLDWELIFHIDWELALVYDLVTNRTPIRIPDRGFIIQWGIHFGASLLTLTQANRDINSKHTPVVGIELFSESYSKECYADLRDNVPACGFSVEHDVIIVHAENKSYLNTFWKSPTRLAFIDGGHDYKIVTEDIKAIVPNIAEGGCMLFHDYYWEDTGVKRAIHDFFDYYDERKIRAYGFPHSPDGDTIYGFMLIQFD